MPYQEEEDPKMFKILTSSHNFANNSKIVEFDLISESEKIFLSLQLLALSIKLACFYDE